MPRTITGRDHPETSHRAAASIEDHVPTLLDRVREAVRQAGAEGLTADEIEVALGIGGSTARPRLCELREKGEVVRTDRQRPTRSGRQAFVYVAGTGEAQAAERAEVDEDGVPVLALEWEQ